MTRSRRTFQEKVTHARERRYIGGCRHWRRQQAEMGKALNTEIKILTFG